jgi:hypothetical protein
MSNTTFALRAYSSVTHPAVPSGDLVGEYPTLAHARARARQLLDEKHLVERVAILDSADVGQQYPYPVEVVRN